MMDASTPVDPNAVIECRNVDRTFTIGKGILTEKKNLRAVQNVNLTVNRGQVLAVVGESGCGKTTLAKMMLGLLPPTAGDIFFEGTSLEQCDRQMIARRVQPVFQDPYSSLNPRKTLASIIALPLKVHKVGTPEERKRRVEEMMELVGLPRRFLYSYPSQLSGGQRQRVAIARALAMKPEVLICDEPTSALDVSVQAQILNLLQDLRRELDLTYVFISHNLAVVEHMSDQIAVMYLGRLIEYGPAKEVFANPRHPYTQILLDSVLTPEPEFGLPDVASTGGFPNPLDPPPGCAFHPRCPKCLPVCKTQQPMPLVDSDGLVECHLYTGAAAGAREAAS